MEEFKQILVDFIENTSMETNHKNGILQWLKDHKNNKKMMANESRRELLDCIIKTQVVCLYKVIEISV